MGFTTTYLAGAAALMMAGANAHLIMVDPAPFGGEIKDPIGAGGFPCQNVAYSRNTVTTLPAGSTYTLKFDPTHTATHGGGSCQLALSTDLEPTADSPWQVIAGFEGGCPVKNNDGNGPADTFDFEVPAKVASGDYTFAWTWIPRHSGAAEFYMNCGAVTVTGGADSSPSDLPGLFVANVPDVNSCSSHEQNTKFPDFPQELLNVVKEGADPQPPTGSDCIVGGGGSSNPSPPSEPEPSSEPSAQPSAEPTPSPTPSPSVPGGGFVTSTTTGSYPTATPPPSGGAGGLSGDCTGQEGKFNCVGGTQFQQCGSGTWSPLIDTSVPCTEGLSDTLYARSLHNVVHRRHARHLH